ncbi:hypothetical protein GCM10023201_40920 [Actinomycetospora corticicola]|uniref:Tail assembly chaperone n=1 Tax=Actinomycetospora corticicola TaxID=663602 RepID=A0A7Y9DWR8_9PSEU|nr:hypothetical protein [Actinomycetospora corticicola]NYD36824.1 hypothetical protein [Actinomycetospora corticicola]
MTDKNPAPIDDDVDIDLDAAPERDQPASRPAKVRLGGKMWLVAPPDAGLVMEIEDAGTTSRVLQLLFDEQWPDVRPLLDPLRPEQLLELVNQLGDRFGFSQRSMMERATPNRAQRRQRRALPR